MNDYKTIALRANYLDHFIEVYGNRYRRFHFIAMRFKQSIITYKTCKSTLHSVHIDLPKNSIVAIRGKTPPMKCNVIIDKKILLFTDCYDMHAMGIPVVNNRVDNLLHALFKPCDKILFSTCKSNVLFLVTTENPFYRIMTKCRRDQVFKAICSFTEARLSNRSLTLEEVSQLRFFKRYEGVLKQFNKWSHFAFDLCSDSCHLTTCSNPSAYLGKEIFSMLKRSQFPPGPLPSPDFYQCEILLSDTEPVGIAFAISRFEQLELDYVSPMVVANPLRTFRDNVSVLCNDWLMLYQNPDMWQEYGLKYYALQFYQKRIKLKLVLSWLQIQTSEKYKLLYMDLIQVAKILFGEKF